MKAPKQSKDGDQANRPEPFLRPLTQKQGVLLLSGLLVCLAVLVGAYILYCAYHPTIAILHARGPSDYSVGVFHSEKIGVARGYHPDAPVAKRVKDELDRLHNWIDQAEVELLEYSKNRPYYIYVSGENENGKITLRYTGCVTDQAGKTEDYRREETFHLFVRPKDFQLK